MDKQYVVMRKVQCSDCCGTGYVASVTHIGEKVECQTCYRAGVIHERIDMMTALTELGIVARLEKAERNAAYAAGYADHAQGLSKE